MRRKPDIRFVNDVRNVRRPPKVYDTKVRRTMRTVFGGISSALGVAAVLLFKFPTWAFPIGVLGIVFAVSAFGVRTSRRDIGFHVARVGVLASGVALIFTLLMAVYQGAGKVRQRLEAAAEENKKTSVLVGQWQRKGKPELTLELTQGGNIIRTEAYPDNREPREEIGKYLARTGILNIWKPDRRTAADKNYGRAEHNWEVLPNGELLIANVKNERPFVDISGRWTRMGEPPKTDSDPLPESIQSYVDQMETLQARKVGLIRQQKKYQTDKQQVLARVQAHEAAGRPVDDNWRIMAREVDTLNKLQSRVQERIDAVDRVIVRLAAIIRTEGRQEEINSLDISEAEMADLLKTTFELDDKLKIDRDTELLDDEQLEKMLDREKKAGTDQ